MYEALFNGIGDGGNWVSLHTYGGMLGYCMKGDGEVHFEFAHHNVSPWIQMTTSWSM
jgi:hypothetical protein